jgi:hypothetical protein
VRRSRLIDEAACGRLCCAAEGSHKARCRSTASHKSRIEDARDSMDHPTPLTGCWNGVIPWALQPDGWPIQ